MKDWDIRYALIFLIFILLQSVLYVRATIVPEGCKPTLHYNGDTKETLYDCMSIDEGYKWLIKY